MPFINKLKATGHPPPPPKKQMKKNGKISFLIDFFI
jgi:hypothetical protein